VRFFDSQKSYREASGLITASGNFALSRADFPRRSLDGVVQWFLPDERTPKDRSTRIKGTLLHEAAHYLNAIHFAGQLPSYLEEGIATFLQSRLNTEHYQYFRATDRERIEDNARDGLNAIVKLPDFVSFVEGTRGFGRGDEMISRWYGLTYAVVDFIAEGEIGGARASFDKLLDLLETTTHARAARVAGSGRPPPLAGREVLGMLLANLYRTDIETFHKALIQRIMKSYRQL
jgi:hypothetical protein